MQAVRGILEQGPKWLFYGCSGYLRFFSPRLSVCVLLPWLSVASCYGWCLGVLALRGPMLHFHKARVLQGFALHLQKGKKLSFVASLCDLVL